MNQYINTHVQYISIHHTFGINTSDEGLCPNAKVCNLQTCLFSNFDIFKEKVEVILIHCFLFLFRMCHAIFRE